MSTRVVTDKVRLSFPYLFTPRPAMQEGQEPKYSLMLLIPKDDTATLKALRAAEAEAKEAGKTSKWGGKIPSNLKPSIIKDADADGTAEDYPERKGQFYMTVSSDLQHKPGVVDKNNVKIMDQSEVYSGVFGRASLTAFPYSANGSKGVTFGLNNVQVYGYGDTLAGGKKAEDEFGAVEVADEFADAESDDGLL